MSEDYTAGCVITQPSMPIVTRQRRKPDYRDGVESSDAVPVGSDVLRHPGFGKAIDVTSVAARWHGIEVEE
ncbi:hypothetical protein NUW58_g1517 [Xylaria curta]|uniref:Uncharacterized protein n=1 Tax=Xylaria curta TaxID=42375 RepID=A0ACC1PKD4_9PEZI|nr:hypothetical protein NUW58_g1517 [Xylaria curta]